MGRTFPKALFVAGAVVFAACHGSGNTPVARKSGSQPLGTPASTPTRMPDCHTGTAKIPGTYIVMNSDGSVKGGAYNSIDGDWVQGKVTSIPTPSTSPSGGPSPPTQDDYLYVGTYHLKKAKQTGCAYVVTTASGEPLMDSASDDNASFAGTPDFNTALFTMNTTKSGQLVATVRGLSASGGTGTLTLTMGKNTYDTGTLTFTGRIRRAGP